MKFEDLFKYNNERYFKDYNLERERERERERGFLANTDCLKFMKCLDDESVDLIVTDPPYLISYKTGHRKDKAHDFCSEILNDNNYDLIDEYIKECYRIMKDDTAMYMFCSSKTVDYFKQELEKYGFNIKNQIIWVKNNWTAGDLKAQFGQQYEIIFLVNKDRKIFNGKRITDVWNFDRISGKKQLHQNQKPIDLLKQCINYHSDVNDIIFDGFCGSGSTLLASKQLNRRYIGCELDPKYYEISVKRLKGEI